jgi:rhodanese-related sulfurtransferase
MPRTIGRRDVQDLKDEGAQLVDVLPADEFEEEHLPGAINIPLRRIDGEAPERLDRTRAVVVYCWDTT